jgi:hypothetical protein
MMNTMIVVITVSRRVGHVTLLVSVRTCCMNWNGFVFAMACFQPCRAAWRVLRNWQEWRDSNPQPPVLETGALAS